MSKNFKIAIFISGRGSNMEALLKACVDENFPAKCVLVLSNNPEAQGLGIAKNMGIDTAIVDHREFDSKSGFEDAIEDVLKNYDIDLICLAGFMRILSAHFISRRENKIINIHPSLLPDYKGLDTHKRALRDRKKQTGCTVHFVIPEMDEGPVILQKTVLIRDGDDEKTLATKVLQQEHKIYPEAVRMIAENKIVISDDRVKIVAG